MSAAPATIHQQAVMQTINRAVMTWPRHSAKIERASDILMADGVDQVSADLYLVRSRTTAGRVYTVSLTRCECKSFELDGRGCLHQWAIWLYQIAVQRAAVLAERLAREWAPEDAKRLLFARWLLTQGRIGEAA